VALEPDAVEERLGALRVAGYRVVVEGAGGIAVPLDWGFTMLDLAARASLAAVVVSRSGLGALNHVVLTAEALRGRGVEVRGIVLNGAHTPLELAEATNPVALARLLPGVAVLTVPSWPVVDPMAVARRAAETVGLLLGTNE